MVTPGKLARLRALRRYVERLERRVQWLERLSRRYVRGRVTLVLSGLGSIFLVSRILGDGYGWLIAGVFLVAFVGVARYHSRVQASLQRHHAWRRLKTLHIARMTLEWEHIPPPLETPVAMEHPFAADLNLVGSKSLHQLLDTTISQEGSARLRTWLLQPLTEPTQVGMRQDCVRELLPLVTFRDRLALYGTMVTHGPQTRWEGETLRRWLEETATERRLLPWVILLGGLAGITLILGILYALALLPAFWIGSFALYIVLYHYKHQELGTLFAEAFQLEKTLQQFSPVLHYLETYSYGHTPRLAALCQPFCQASGRPSMLLKKLARLAGAASVQQGNLVGPLVNALLPWDLYFAHRLDQYKATLRTLLPVWLDTWYELEALNALAHFGYLNPDYTFPEVQATAESTTTPIFSARQMAHPLLSDTMRVGNDLTMERLGALVLITGSNMSGKSTFLRTVGLNLCLTFAGAPVCATALRTVPLRLYTCITVSDAILDGISYFYAEVRRLKALLEALTTPHAWPLFFCIDEIFRGTNNRERLIGSRAYIQALARGHGAGLVSTHDLELVTLVQEVPGVRNAHFRDDVVNGRMVFDYLLRPGPCPTTNALTIMRLEGLPMTNLRPVCGL